ncbi:MAG TPA: nucleotidyltransferase [Flexistipes sinusarabici]|uniref:Nucleotidyltransferase n=1 Tax=Flexistipes sinusarabici TaxID=2352 RepID=A0A3D5QFU4_FLESI|nr:nucleotidyltransferase [Flexistipes sinusarabici]
MPAAKNELTKEQILRYLREHKKELYEKYGVSKIGLFGSYAYGAANSDSDIDIAVEITRNNKTLHNFLSLKRDLEETFGRQVDLGIENNLKPFIKEKVEREIIYA